jgi:hypothetical protein
LRRRNTDEQMVTRFVDRMIIKDKDWTVRHPDSIGFPTLLQHVLHLNSREDRQRGRGWVTDHISAEVDVFFIQQARRADVDSERPAWHASWSRSLDLKIIKSPELHRWTNASTPSLWLTLVLQFQLLVSTDRSVKSVTKGSPELTFHSSSGNIYR